MNGEAVVGGKCVYTRSCVRLCGSNKVCVCVCVERVEGDGEISSHSADAEEK